MRSSLDRTLPFRPPFWCRGGHVGFRSRDGDWLSRMIVRYLSSRA